VQGRRKVIRLLELGKNSLWDQPLAVMPVVGFLVVTLRSCALAQYPHAILRLRLSYQKKNTCQAQN